jgi:hypothetical protein
MKEVYNTCVLRKGLSGTLKQSDKLFETCRVFFCVSIILRIDLNFEVGNDETDRNVVENCELESVA